MYMTSLIATIGLMASVALAAPLEPRAAQRVLIFGGGTPEAYYTIEPPHGVDFTINHPETSVSRIALYGAGQCTIKGIDGSETTARNSQTVAVGPPQVQVSGICYA